MRRFILPVCAAFVLAACSQTSTERQSNSNGNRNAGAPTHSTTSADGAATANHTHNANTVNPDMTNNMTNTNQNPAASTAPQGRITIEEARELVAQDKAIIVDVRGDSSYEASHIKGSISIPGGDIGARAKELPKDKKIIAYCS